MDQSARVHLKRPFGIAAVVLFLLGSTTRVYAQDPYLGEIRLVPYNFAPVGWYLCNGQILSIAQNTALFSLIGTTYGGDGRTTFALPDLRGRVPISSGQGPGLSNHVLGESSGEETHTLTTNEMPAHTHTMSADSSVGSTDRPNNGLLARNAAGIPQYGTGSTTQLTGVQSAGGSQAHNNMQPYLTLNYIIAYQGIYPPRPTPPPNGEGDK